MRKRKGWSDFDTEEKLEALRADVLNALDLADGLKKSQEKTDRAIRQIVEAISELQRNVR